ncbi:MAG: dTMP kinase [Dehalococcoidia bacterium]|nr:dTMP kinase [Dehalococcoidia bacterium]
MAIFIVFEGGDGSGKSTQARNLSQRLRRRSIPVLLTREPGGTPSGESIRRLLKGQRSFRPMSELLLFEAARAQLVESVIRPGLDGGTTVICDRYTASTVAYQGHGRGLGLALIQQLNEMATGGLVPDLTVLLDLSPLVGLSRRGAAGSDPFESAPQEFQSKVREGYLAQAAEAPERWLVLDGSRPQSELSREIWTKVQPLL